MSQRIASAELTQIASVSSSPALTRVERNFGLPSGLYTATVGAYLGFVGLMALLFINGEVVLPMAVIVLTIVMGFGLGRTWWRMKPENPTSPLSWGQFANRGIMTESGPLTAFEASIQVLMLPVLILFWGVCIAVIVALS